MKRKTLTFFVFSLAFFGEKKKKKQGLVEGQGKFRTSFRSSHSSLSLGLCTKSGFSVCFRYFFSAFSGFHGSKSGISVFRSFRFFCLFRVSWVHVRNSGLSVFFSAFGGGSLEIFNLSLENFNPGGRS